MTLSKRGRPKKHAWTNVENLNADYSAEAQYLKWSSVNNSRLASSGHYGCPKCGKKNSRLRHDTKFKNIRFYCPECGYETSFQIRTPQKIDLRVKPTYNKEGTLINESNADDYHEKTKRETGDLAVLAAEQRVDLGGEWFDGYSGIHRTNRYLTREEALENIRRNNLRAILEALDEETEFEDTLLELETENSNERGNN
jgi:predicted RNA-binding Zn-ribbon protein involved in translation (DUF1610 family)